MSPLKIELALPESRPVCDGDVTWRITLPAEKVEKLFAFMNDDAWEKAQAIRATGINECKASLQVALNWALKHDTSGARVFATLLASMYNGRRVKLNVSDLKLLDQGNFEHAMNCIRLCQETHREPHEFFQNGGELFERMIQQWGFEKKQRRAS